MKRAAVAGSLLVFLAGCRPGQPRSPSSPPDKTGDLLAILKSAGRGSFQRSLSVRLAKQGHCAAALFHWARANQLAHAPQKKKHMPPFPAACAKKLTPKPPNRPDDGQARLWRALRSPLVFLPAVTTYYGSNDDEKAWAASHCKKRALCTMANWPPLARVHLAAFSMSRTEVTVDQWNRCVQAGACTNRAKKRLSLPMTGIDMRQAEDYCRWTGGRLPTEQEWERAARPAHRAVVLWPWGNYWIANCARLERPEKAGPAPVGTHPCDLSPGGLVDMAGNVAEWTRPSESEQRRGLGLVKGGSWSDPRWRASVFARRLVTREHRDPHLGFRCVWPGPRKPARRN